MNLILEPYEEQKRRWPRSGRHILAQHDEASVVVYQAYSPAIGCFAAEHGYFGGAFSYGRMSWIKPNFLWMMYRSGWGTKPDQEVTLAVRLRRPFFEALLGQAVPSTRDPRLCASEAEWKREVGRSTVRLQWDPDHGPSGQPLERRAIQLGLRHEALREYGRDAVLEIEDISPFVAEQRAHARTSQLTDLRTPAEHCYVPGNRETVWRLGLDAE